MMIIVPGVAVTLAVYPDKRGLEFTHRLALVFLFGFTPQLLLYFLTKNFSVPITATTSYLAIAAVTVVGIIVWQIRLPKKAVKPAATKKKTKKKKK